MTSVDIDTSPLPEVTLKVGEFRTDQVMVTNREDFILHNVTAHSADADLMVLSLSMSGPYQDKIRIGNVEPRTSFPIWVKRYAPPNTSGTITTQIRLEGHVHNRDLDQEGPTDEDMEYVMRSLGVIPKNAIPKKRLPGLARIRRAVRPSAHDR